MLDQGGTKIAEWEGTWGRGAPQSLAEIAVTHYYAHAHAHTHIKCCGIQRSWLCRGDGQIIQPRSRTLVWATKIKSCSVFREQ